MDLLDYFDAVSFDERIVGVEGNGVSQEIYRVVLNAISLGKLRKSHFIDIHSFMGFFVIFFEPLDKLEKSLASPLLKETHEIGL